MAMSTIPSVSARYVSAPRLQIESDDPPPRLPEQRLIVGTILSAIFDAHNPQRGLYCTDVDNVRARIWLDDTTSEHVFSLRWCCLQLDWDVEAVAVAAALRRDPQGVVERLNAMTYRRKVGEAKRVAA